MTEAKTKKFNPASKATKAAIAYLQMNGENRSVPRKSIIARFMQPDINLSENGAKTYLGNFRAGIWKISDEVRRMAGQPVSAAPTQEVAAATLVPTEPVRAFKTAEEILENVTMSDMAKMYNSKAEHSITKFRDRKTAVARLKELYGEQLEEAAAKYLVDDEPEEQSGTE